MLLCACLYGFKELISFCFDVEHELRVKHSTVEGNGCLNTKNVTKTEPMCRVLNHLIKYISNRSLNKKM